MLGGRGEGEGGLDLQKHSSTLVSGWTAACDFDGSRWRARICNQRLRANGWDRLLQQHLLPTQPGDA